MKSGRPFAAFDIDGTLIRWQLYHAVADNLVKLGYFERQAFEPIRDARMDWKKRTNKESFKIYEQQLVETYQSLLNQVTTAQFDQAAQAVFEEYKDQVYRYTRDLIADLKKQGYVLLAISNSQIEIVSKIAEYYNFDDYVGIVYEHKNGRFTGRASKYLHNKHEVLNKLVDKHQLTWAGSIAVGDSASDISMLAVVEQPIAFNPEQKLFNEAVMHGWKIVVERKNVIYEMRQQDGSYLLAQTGE